MFEGLIEPDIHSFLFQDLLEASFIIWYILKYYVHILRPPFLAQIVVIVKITHGTRLNLYYERSCS